ncbi:hypothetical protein ACFSQD_01875 [Flavihumibacter stibioxidans]|uniref:Gliding motility-associated lipoprotein GldH n=1 Tax=Flavihumibacter stibioxidans TaxID=1834163 RepID=A0ABR7MC78_9BACT|nr:hypothetical protein [Flavihumibacter stibioxidans]MBC6492231.1 hypothetical protein [Flavihumibacter stibioxidans]
MIRKLVPVLLFTAILAGCNKDKFNTKPSIEVKEHTSIVSADNEALFSISLEFTDKEGDLSGVDSAIYYQAFYLNVRDLVGGPVSSPAYDRTPSFPEKNSGEIQLRLPRFGYYKDFVRDQGTLDKNDTLIFRIALRDKAGNVSDTISSGPIVLLGQ